MRCPQFTLITVVWLGAWGATGLHGEPRAQFNPGAPTSAATLSNEALSRFAPQSAPRPKRRVGGDAVPRARWDHRPAGRIWTRAAISALKAHGRPILQTVPRDIEQWCPAYPAADLDQRAAFWAGFLSALAKHESTYRQAAVGGGGRWYGLLQILPATARGYKCTAPSREGLKHGPSNLSCAIRILAVVMPRDKVMASKDTRWRGVAADWGPMRISAKREDIAGWTRQQKYCRKSGAVRPRMRP
ncbi:transglycosylase SLT domain-containing protein [Planktotalea arctica]|uniref:transglycosylase SLT domain-containing protein n=1 Tax=Planktotalea arctica TaxID=1481893 RepID=UPI00321C1D91